MAEIIFNKDIEHEVKTEIERFLWPYTWLIPGWCQFLHINCWANDDHKPPAAIRTGAVFEYRRAHMDFYALWLIESDEIKQIHVIHDLLHISNTVYIDFTEDAIHNAYEGGGSHLALRAYLFEHSRKLCEAMTQDLAYAIYNRLKREA